MCSLYSPMQTWTPSNTGWKRSRTNFPLPVCCSSADSLSDRSPRLFLITTVFSLLILNSSLFCNRSYQRVSVIRTACCIRTFVFFSIIICTLRTKQNCTFRGQKLVSWIHYDYVHRSTFLGKQVFVTKCVAEDNFQSLFPHQRAIYPPTASNEMCLNEPSAAAEK